MEVRANGNYRLIVTDMSKRRHTVQPQQNWLLPLLTAMPTVYSQVGKYLQTLPLRFQRKLIGLNFETLIFQSEGKLQSTVTYKHGLIHENYKRKKRKGGKKKEEEKVGERKYLSI